MDVSLGADPIIYICRKTMKTIEMSKIFCMNVITPFKTKILTKFSVYISFSLDFTAVTSIYYYYCALTENPLF